MATPSCPHVWVPEADAGCDPTLPWTLIVVGAGGPFLGAGFTGLWVRGVRLKQMFGVLIVIMSAYKIYTLL